MASFDRVVTRRAPLLVVLWLAALAFAVPCAAQQSQPPQPQAPQGPGINSQVNLVNLFVTVRDKNKKIVPNLQQQDFRVFEDGQEQKIACFSKEVSRPIPLALLLATP